MKRSFWSLFASQIIDRFAFRATDGKVAASTQRQALNAIIFLYREVLDVELGDITPIRSKKQRKPPTVLTQNEVQQILRVMEGTHRVMAQLLYGCGLRLMECIRLRIQDLDLNRPSPYFLRKLSALRFGGRGVFLSVGGRAERTGRLCCRKPCA